MNKIIKSIVLMSSLFIFSANAIDIGFEENSIFKNYGSQTLSSNAIVNIYLDKTADITADYRLIINKEDTELNLAFNVVTRFGVNKSTTTIGLVKNNKDIMNIHLDLESKMDYYLIIKDTQDSLNPTITIMDKKTLGNEIEQTPLYTSDNEEQEDTRTKEEVQVDEAIYEQIYIQKQDLGITNDISPTKSVKKNKDVKKVEVIPKEESAASIQERYDNGESIFYYDPDDGE